MKILTKEWMKYNRQVILTGQTKKIKERTTLTQFDLYNKLYKEKQDEFIELERSNPVYDENETGVKRDFNKEYAKRLFKARIENNEELIREMPETVLSHIQNVKLLALKYCLPNEEPFLQSFYEKGLSEIEETTQKARNITEDSAQYLRQNIDFDFFTEEIVYGIKNENGNLLIKFDGCYLVVKNFSIIEKEQDGVCDFNIDDPYCGMTVLHAIELYYDENTYTFEFHLLLDNIDSLDIPTFWYLTVKCDDIYTQKI